MGCVEGGRGNGLCKRWVWQAEFAMRLTILYFLWVPSPTSHDGLLHQVVVAEAMDEVIGGHVLGIRQPPMIELHPEKVKHSHLRGELK